MTEENKQINNAEELIQKINDFAKQNKMDLSSEEDLSIAIMNLVGMEEHFFFTGAKTGKSEYYGLLAEVRSMRVELLKKIVKEPEGEVWCISKHLLAASMRLMEVGTKAQSAGRKEEAQDLFQKAYDLYAMFWGINLKIINTDDIKKIDENALNKHDEEKNGLPVGRQGFMGKLRAIVQKVIDCCIE